MVDSLREVFNEDALAHLQRTAANDDVRLRLEILSAPGPLPNHQPTNPRATWLAARKAAWCAYLNAAFACGLFEGVAGRELRARLTGVNEDNFRSGLAECMTCWLLADRLGQRVTPRPTGREKKVPDLFLPESGSGITVEVKSPHQKLITGRAFWVNDSELLGRTVEKSNRQFTTGRQNLLVIVIDRHENPWFAPRDELVAALFGRNVLKIVFRRDTGETVSQSHEFSPSGKFLRVWDADAPRFTRVSAVLQLWETFVRREDQTGFIEQHWLVLHNPHCKNPIPPELFGNVPQFVTDGEEMRWMDGAPAVD